MKRGIAAGGPRRLATLAVAAAVSLSGCLVQLRAPEIELTTAPAYNDPVILIPYRLSGERMIATAWWTLGSYTGTGYEQLESREIRVPSGSSRILELDGLSDGRYELVFEMMTTRGGEPESVPYLTQRREFYVDRVPPDSGGIVRRYFEDGIETAISPASLAPNATVELEIDAPAHQPEWEAPTRILYTLNDPRPPEPELDEYSGRLLLWQANEYSPQVIVIVAVDEAGNRSGAVVDAW